MQIFPKIHFIGLYCHIFVTKTHKCYTMKKNCCKLLPEVVAREYGIVYIDLRNDYAFKRVFGTPGNEDLLLLLVQAFLPDQNIVSVTLNNQEQMGEGPNSRKAVFDICCTTDNGSIVNVEMQLSNQKNFGERMVYYSGFPVRDNLGWEGSVYDYPPVYIIGIMDFIMDIDMMSDDVINRFQIKNMYGDLLSERMHYITVELPKFNKRLSELQDSTDMLIYLLKHMGELNKQPKEFSGEKFDKLFKLTKFAAMGHVSQMEYVRQYMAELDEKNRILTATEKGLEQGLEEGLEQGLEQVARNMKADGMSIEMISKYTGLSVWRIKQL